jgi:hypothetical protein
MNKKIIFFSIIAILFITSCKRKKETEPDNTAIRMQLMTASPWNGDTGKADIDLLSSTGGDISFLLQAAGIDPNALKNLSVDVSQLSVTFKTDGTFTGKDLSGASVSGNWQLLENGNKLKLSGLPLTIPISMVPANVQSFVTQDDLTLPDTFDIRELTDIKFVLYTEKNIPKTVPNPINPATSLPIIIKPKITINLKK